MNVADVAAAYSKHISNPYIAFLNRMGLLIYVESAEGALVVDSNGKSYIDCIAGYGNCVLGHNPRPVIEAVIMNFVHRGHLTFLLSRKSRLGWPNGSRLILLATLNVHL
jgi:glutamate-1-semialdehyde aminotransferase